ncbi:MAG TPA: methylmalonyl-CoA epimerase, partial [Thermoplasmata archaeon]|nr:methylmalonyl-CoA epimerase [Thermoplasmata archaeon]
NVDHLGIAVRSLSATTGRWEKLLGASASAPEEVSSQSVRVAFLEAGPTHIELLEPTGPDSPVGRFLESRGEGIHHVAFAVPSVNEQLSALLARGERVIDRAGRPGARGRVVGFAHPAAFGGVLVEFVERR